ncbi:hypothetical protein AMELA_G00145460 [Ameiurus melas]|uniref:Uncharacterized protein n=1 Tax=Ameiurus melas TaxID=219545 RepID=A0A7J6AIN4_AMEME|nr:hypothetical protein AMELA_G00145460 [Ameiurus melas]
MLECFMLQETNRKLQATRVQIILITYKTVAGEFLVGQFLLEHEHRHGPGAHRVVVLLVTSLPGVSISTGSGRRSFGNGANRRPLEPGERHYTKLEVWDI